MSVWTDTGLFKLWGAVMLLYSIIALIFSIKTWNPGGILGVFAGTFLTHIVYGIWFIAGLSVSEIRDS